MTHASSAWSMEMQVRDYELDMQGIVNNAVYQNYLEHARHEYIKTRGLDFAEFSKRGVNFVAIRIELDYKYPLKSGDRFSVSVQVAMESPLRIVFDQAITRLPDSKLICKGKVFATALNERGRPIIPDEVKDIITT
ncbi:MAG: acyl-CoA thioesterase [Fibrobacterota bacterium]|nr:thioesterase family protein [Chitinispirillaceae bacterium]